MLDTVAIVTGAAGGIGKELVARFARRGYFVIAIDVKPRPDDLECGGYLQVDLQRIVSDYDYASDTFSSLRRLMGRRAVSVVINNAAIQLLGGVESLSVSDWRITLDVNLLAPFIIIQELLPLLEASEGCVINISSIHARLTKPGFVAYATSKAALSSMTRAMAVDLGGRVRINAIEPAAIATEMLKAGFLNDAERYAQLKACHPQCRVGTPAEVAALAVSIADGDFRFLHGACVAIDGGISGRLNDPD